MTAKAPAAKAPAAKPPAAKAPAAKAPAAKPPAVGAQRRPALMRPATAVVGTLAVVALLLASSVRAWMEQRAALAEERTRVDQVAADLDRLRAESDRWNDPDYVKAQARERLNFRMPGEKVFVVIDDRKKVPVTTSPTDVVAREVERSDEVWFTRLWDSIEIAGRTP